MNRENIFTRRFSAKSSDELKGIIRDKKHFEKDAVQAAIWLLEDRDEGSSLEVKVQEELNIKNESEEEYYMQIIGIPFNTASPYSRFLHCIIDALIVLAINMLISFIPLPFLINFSVWVIFPIYYIFFEWKFQQTPGKMVTNTIVVNKTGEKPEPRDIVLRTLVRYIPFEALSCFGPISYGWHDKWTNTIVINKRNLSRLQEYHALKQ